MDSKTLKTFIPASDNSPDIKAAIARAVGVRADISSNVATLEARLVTEALSLTGEARKAIRAELADHADDMVQLDAIATQLEERLDGALEAERVAAEENAHAELLVNIARDEAEWSKAYPQLARQLRRLVDARLALVGDVFRHNQTLGKSRSSLFIDGLDDLRQSVEEINLPLSDEERLEDIRQDRAFFNRVENGNFKQAARVSRAENRRVPLELILAFRRER